jgi:hypothetical protein
MTHYYKFAYLIDLFSISILVGSLPNNDKQSINF